MAGPETDSAKPKPEASKTSAAGGGDATKYVGTPAVGTSKAAAAGGLATVGPEPSEINRKRRRLVWVTVTGFLGAWFIAFLRFFLPRTLFEPPTVFKIGYASDYALGVDTKWQQKYRIWVDRTPDRVFVIYARCTHLGCTPNWLETEQKYKCPCHGSGYYIDGVNFEGPTPRPLERFRIFIDGTGNIIVDKSKKYRKDLQQWNENGSYLSMA